MNRAKLAEIKERVENAKLSSDDHGHDCSALREYCERELIYAYDTMAPWLTSQLESAWDRLEELTHAVEMGAFHHSSCGANWYEEGSMKENWDGIGEHRNAKPCTCAHYKIDLALSNHAASMKGEE